MSEQLQTWRGDFGRAYTRRNNVDWRTRTTGFHNILKACDIYSILEVGCNRGHNLQALRTLYPHAVIRGVEPQRYARKLAQQTGLDVRNGTIYDTRYATRQFDLTLACGVLTHIPPDMLDVAINELARVSNRYILNIDYPADTEHEVEYRGRPALLWKRDYTTAFLDALPELKLVRSGGLDEHFDNSGFWLWEKP
jgi:pseudaminic acid biosynthesis-associated methylase